MRTERQRILIVHIGGLTETILGLPALRALRQHFSDSQISIVTSAAAADIALLGDCADAVMPVARLNTDLLSPTLAWRSLRLAQSLRDSMFDLVIELHRSRESQLLLRSVRYAKRLGTGEPSVTGLVRLIGRVAQALAQKPAVQEHLAQRYLRLIEPLGVRPIEAEPRLRTEPQNDQKIEKWLARGGIRSGDLLIGIDPGAGARINRWPFDRYVSVAQRLIHNFDARIVVLGGPAERGIAKNLSRKLPSGKSLVLQSPKLSELVSLLARLTVLVTNHSGPAHLAASVRTPVVVASTMNVSTDVNLLSKSHIQLRGASPEMILEEELYEATCRLIKASRAEALWS
jgi:ADP-heptose:LPS heptosyltransferase